jgi:hypothetical protein
MLFSVAYWNCGVGNGDWTDEIFNAGSINLTAFISDPVLR